MRLRVAIAVVSAGVAAGCLSACNLLQDDSLSLMAYTCTKPALRSAGQLEQALKETGLRASLIPACDSGRAYVRFRPTGSVTATAAELARLFDCEEVVDPAAVRSLALRCTIDQSRFLAVLSWDERKAESGKPIIRLNGEATFVRGKADEDVILDPTP